MAADDGQHSVLSAPPRASESDLVESLFSASGPRSTGTLSDDSPTPQRSSSRHRPAAHRNRLAVVIPVIALLVIVAVAVAGVVIARTALRSLKNTPDDYKGSGTGQVTVRIKPGDGSRNIAKTLHDSDVVASTQAFLNAADKSGRSADFESGWFTVRHRMSGVAAVALLLDPRARSTKKVTIPEGMIELAVLAAVAKATGLSIAELTKASKDLPGIGVPSAFGATSAEGFLFPSTYQFDPDVSASDALQQMTTQFQVQTRRLNLLASATSLRLRPYNLLIIASMVEAEARFAVDRPRVARVILNRLAQHMKLGFDSTTAYGLKIQGKDPRTATYKEISPYNTRVNAGLPPTPIGNPGEAALQAAQRPTPGNWLYFVSKDAAGHLLFTKDSKVFDVASEKCRVNKWGCT